jgi:cytochrome d ubiquinol oxidase subunit II
METFWYTAVALMLAIYVVLDGFDFGVGTLYPFLGRTEADRHVMHMAIGPVWNGNEVWLIAAGAVLFLAFPKAYAAGFSGFYLALIIVLWLFMFRGLAMELRSHVDHPLWRQLCDATFFGASLSLAVVFGVALGNLIRGVPLNRDRVFLRRAVDKLHDGSRARDSGLVHNARGTCERRDLGLTRSHLSRNENDGRLVCAGRGGG